MLSPAITYIMGMIIGCMVGFGYKPLMKKARGYTNLFFIDKNVVITKYGYPEQVTIGKGEDAKTFMIDQSRTPKNLAIFDSRFSEQMQIDISPDFSNWKYYISSKTAHTALSNKLLQQLLLIQESQFIKLILVLVIICILVSGFALYNTMQLQESITALGNVALEIKKVVVVG